VEVGVGEATLSTRWLERGCKTAKSEPLRNCLRKKRDRKSTDAANYNQKGDSIWLGDDEQPLKRLFASCWGLDGGEKSGH